MKHTIIAAAAMLAALLTAPNLQADTGNAGFLDGSTEALIMGPTGYPAPPAGYISTADSLYLHPLGFDGTTVALTTPETTDYGPSVTAGETDLINAVTNAYATGHFSASDPLTVFGYSQSAVVAGLAEQQLANDGIPSDALRFVLVGDTASAEGGYLNTWGETPFGTAVLDFLGWQNLVGDKTPDNLYPTDVYTIQGDYFADYPHAAWDGGAIHEAYLGLTPEMISSATPTVDGLTTYFDIAAPTNLLDALWTALLNVTG